MKSRLADTAARHGDEAGEPTGYAWYVSVVLMLVYTLSYIDRKMPFILLQPIKADLHLSDTQMGLITGLMFALVYGLAGIPLGALADRASRKRLVGCALLLWGGITAAGGLAMNFWQLALARVGVAAGEAACTPAAHSLLADYFPQRFRARAMGLYTVGSPLGILLGLALGGVINDLANWRVAMFVLGAPGAVLALVVFLTVKEAPRKIDHIEQSTGRRPTTWDAIRTFIGHPALRHMLIGQTLIGVTSAAIQAFAPAYIMRTFGMSTSSVGLTYGLVFGSAGIAGSLLGGAFGDRLRRKSPWQAILMISISTAIGTPAIILGLLSGNYLVFLACIFVMSTGYIMVGAPSFATIQSILSPRMHAVGTAVVLLGLSGVGMSVGPLVAGLISDALHGMGPDRSLKWALVILSLPNLWAAGHFAVAALKLRGQMPIGARPLRVAHSGAAE
jgi:MFS family permease